MTDPFGDRVAVITGGGGGIGRALARGGVIGADEVATRVVRALERDDLYVLTHIEQREILRRRAARQDATFEDGSWPSRADADPS